MNGMNETLARLYGTGLDKTASAEEDLDLSQISAADFLAAVENGDIVMNDGEELEKEAEEEELDLESMSPDELVELAQYLDSLEGEQDDGEALEKMAESGELEHWDTVGRIMAHSYADEMSKVASDDEYEDELFSLDELSAEDLMEGIESGELELVELDGDFEKEAGRTERAAQHATDRILRRHRKGSALTKTKKGMGAKLRDLLGSLNTATGGKYRRGANEAFSAARKETKSIKRLKGMKGYAPDIQGAKARRLKNLKQFGARGAIGYGAPAVAVGGTGAGAYAFNKRKKKN